MLLTVPPIQVTRVAERAIGIVDVLAQNSPQPGLYARWERVNGRLVRAWFRNPD